MYIFLILRFPLIDDGVLLSQKKGFGVFSGCFYSLNLSSLEVPVLCLFLILRLGFVFLKIFF